MLSDAQVRALQGALEALATERSRAFWDKYLKGSATFRGVPMAGVRRAVHAWWHSEGLAGWPLEARKQAALRLFEEAHTEDRMAGVLILSELLLSELGADDLPGFERLFVQGHIADWNLCDWFCVKVPGKMLEVSEAPSALAEAISRWRHAEPLWQRRASCVSFVEHARHGDARIEGLSGLLLANAEALVQDPARFAQTGVGWALRELSLADRQAVIDFAHAHIGRLSLEAVKSLAEKMPTQEKDALVALHKAHRRRAAR